MCVKSILSAGFSFFKSVAFQRKTRGVGVGNKSTYKRRQ